MSGIPLGILTTFVLAVIRTWLVMLLAGLAHSIEPGVPAVGFLLTAVLVVTYDMLNLDSERPRG